MSVDLPAPFSPQMAWTSARRTDMLTSSSARTPGNSLVMLRISSSGFSAIMCVSFDHRCLNVNDVITVHPRPLGVNP